MGAIASLITSLMIIYSTVHSSTNQRKQQCSASLAFVRGIRRWPVNSPHKGPVTRKMFPFEDVIMYFQPSITHLIIRYHKISKAIRSRFNNFNIKTVCCVNDSHYKDKAIMRPSYLYYGNSYVGKNVYIETPPPHWSLEFPNRFGSCLVSRLIRQPN